MNQPDISALWHRLFKEDLTLAEKQALTKWYQQADGDPEILPILETAWNRFEPHEKLTEDRAAAMLEDILSRKVIPVSGTARIARLTKSLTVAASILLLMLAGGYFWLNRNGGQVREISAIPVPIQAPWTNKAAITLADGKILPLDSLVHRPHSLKDAEFIQEADGEIIYSAKAISSPRETRYNTLNNPRGSQVVHMRLSDGTRVWLNAGSSLTYPVAFIGTRRTVTLSGEAYFEVAFQKDAPFSVNKENTRIDVLGTAFNVHAYEEEPSMKVTLLEGSVKVSQQQNSKLLRPGMQATITANIAVVEHANIEEVMAWKNGLFYFAGTEIGELMRMISRWYDVDIVYENDVTDLHFRGDISRQSDLNKVLQLLEATGTVHFRVEGKKVFVSKAMN